VRNAKQRQDNPLRASSLPPLWKHLTPAANPSQSQDQLSLTSPNSQKNFLPDHGDGVKDIEAKHEGNLSSF